MKRKLYYLGYDGGKYEMFASLKTPEPQEHKYMGVVGPFVTKRAALWAVKHGARNPHFTCVADAERISRGIK